MDFELSADQRKLQDAAIAFAKEELNDDMVQRDHSARFSAEGWRACAGFGVQGLPMPRELGGRAADIVTTAAVMEGLGYGGGDTGLIFSINAQMWGVQMPLLEFGSEAQRGRFLPGLISGEVIAAHGATEPESGSDVFSMSTRAERRGEEYVLNGRKIFITCAPVADLALIFATVDPSRGRAGISAFLVPRSNPGMSVRDTSEKMGLRTAPMGEITLTDCRVPMENRLGAEGAGMGIFNFSIGWERSCILASSLGVMRRQLETAVDYARSRRQFGQAIGKFQGVSDKLADMYVRLTAARLLVYQAAWLGQKGRPAAAEAAAAKLFVSDASIQSGLDAIQIHGGRGYLSAEGIERDLRDAVASRIYSGTSEIQRVIVSRMLGL